MPNRTQTFGLLLVLLLVAIAYLAITLPTKVIEQYHNASQHNAMLGYAYLVVVGLGVLMLGSILITITWRVWRNSVTRDKQERRRGTDPSQLSRAQQRAELGENLQAGLGFAGTGGLSDAVREEIRKTVDEIEEKREAQELEIVAFGAISSGKSSLLNALAGRDVFRTNVVGGTTTTHSRIDWPGSDAVVLTDTPGLAEVSGEARARTAAEAARQADLVLMVVDGPLRDFEVELLKVLHRMEKRILICLNKADWFSEADREKLCGQIAEQVAGIVAPEDVVAVRSSPVERPVVRVLSDGNEEKTTAVEPPDIEPLAKRLLAIVGKERETLLLANLLMQSRGMVDAAKERVLATLDQQAERIVKRYMWASGGATAVNPVPLLDIAGGTALTVKMVLDLAHVYQQKIDAETIIELLSQLAKSLIAMLGASAAAPAIASGVATLLKTIPGVGTIAGGLLQGLVQALVTRWVGRVFMKYFRTEMSPPAGGFAELARREWEELTRPDQLRKLIVWGRRELDNQPTE